MTKITNLALFFLAAGILTSVSILSIYQVLFAIPVCYYTYLAIKNKDFSLPKSAYWLLGFAIIALITTTIHADLMPKPSKNLGRIKYFLYGGFGIFALKAWLNEASDLIKKRITSIFLFSICLSALYCIYTYFTSTDERARGFTETMRYGYGSAMILLTLLSAILHKDKTSEWLDIRFGIIAFVLGFTGMYLTHTRGALLGFLCGLPFVLYFYRPKLGLIVGGGAGALVTLLAGFYLFGNVEQGSGSRFLINKNNHSDQVRRSQWKAAVIAIQERPILGWGLSNFHSQLKRIKEKNNLDAKEYNDAHAHNLFLEIAAGTGLVGLFFFLGWIISWAYEAFKFQGLTRALVIPFGVAFVISSQFEVTFDANNASMIFFLYSLSSTKIVQKVRDTFSSQA
ncbi:MAG: O-antigen ligase family protein [Bacteriovoracaceae bacterium]